MEHESKGEEDWHQRYIGGIRCQTGKIIRCELGMERRVGICDNYLGNEIGRTWRLKK